MNQKNIKDVLIQLERCEKDIDVAYDMMIHLLNEVSIEDVLPHTTITTRKLFLRLAIKWVEEERPLDALPILEGLIQFEKPYASNPSYKQFHNIFEYYYYVYIYEPKEEIILPEEPILYYLVFYGMLLNQVNRQDEALTIFQKVLHYNPLCAEAYFEMADIHRQRGDLYTFYEMMMATYDIAYEASVIAKVYRNFGYYFVETQDYAFAKLAYFVSSHYENHPSVSYELAYISDLTQSDIQMPSLDDIEDAFIQKGLHPTPNEKLTIFMLTLAETMEEDDEFDDALTIYELYYQLMGSEEILHRIEILKQKRQLNA